MEIWLDTIDPFLVHQAKNLGILDGVTTNPTLLSQSKEPLRDTLTKLLLSHEGCITVQVVADDCDEMVRQGKALQDISWRIIVKVPFSQEGLKAIHCLSSLRIMTMATVIFTPQQALLASKAGASYVAPYLGRMESNGLDPWKTLESMLTIYRNYEIRTKILAASIRDVSQIVRCAEIGVDAITLKDELFKQFIEIYPLTEQGISQFAVDWEKVTDKSLFN